MPAIEKKVTACSLSIFSISWLNRHEQAGRVVRIANVCWQFRKLEKRRNCIIIIRCSSEKQCYFERALRSGTLHGIIM